MCVVKDDVIFYILVINICDPIFKICVLCHKLTLTDYTIKVSWGTQSIV